MFLSSIRVAKADVNELVGVSGRGVVVWNAFCSKDIILFAAVACPNDTRPARQDLHVCMQLLALVNMPLHRTSLPLFQVLHRARNIFICVFFCFAFVVAFVFALACPIRLQTAKGRLPTDGAQNALANGMTTAGHGGKGYSNGFWG